MPKHTIFNTVLALFLLVPLFGLSSCTLGPDFQEPDISPPKSYRTSVVPSETAADLSWWELFEDPVLFSLVTTALENNRDVKTAVSRIAQAQANLGFVGADRYPTLSGDGGASTGNFNGGSRSSTTNSTVYLGAPLTWEIDFWGKYRRATEAARAQLEASRYGLRSIQLTLIADVVSAYYQLLDFRRRLLISKRTLDSRRESLRIIEQRFEKGVIAEIDVNQAQIQTESAAAAIPVYRRLIARTENSLSILTGGFPGPITISGVGDSAMEPPVIPAGLPSDILTRRPDISQAKYLLKAQVAGIGVAEALRWPTISLTGTLGIASTEIGSVRTEGGVWSVGGRLLGPIIDFGKNKSRVTIEEQKAEQALYQFENTVLFAFREVEDSLVDIETYRTELSATRRQLKAALSANELSKARYDKGVSSYLEVLDTERTLFSTAIKHSEIEQLYFNAYVGLYKALGGGWITPEEYEKRAASESLDDGEGPSQE